MSTLNGIVYAVSTVVFLGLVGRAVVRLLDEPDAAAADRVPAWERHGTTALGVPVALLALSTAAEGWPDFGFVSAPFVLAGASLLLYPDFAPRHAGG
ncbi:hypothetical protein [Halorubellus sp. PRR65]|uniref:hypothetical protein n=1 Tax=Halorubellus sp. PRR65 TaxID=3098148 RepID=UPI002B259DE3|nr:hypothetical protein [Halorubellus sp. PRR65]